MAPPPILTLDDVALGFGGAPLFDGLSLAIGAGELRPDTPVRQVVMLITPLWYFGSLLTQHSGLNKLLDHYKAVTDTIAAAYGI